MVPLIVPYAKQLTPWTKTSFSEREYNRDVREKQLKNSSGWKYKITREMSAWDGSQKFQFLTLMGYFRFYVYLICTYDTKHIYIRI
jgi:hypothetical protein